jgi:hypothetical protein
MLIFAITSPQGFSRPMNLGTAVLAPSLEIAFKCNLSVPLCEGLAHVYAGTKKRIDETDLRVLHNKAIAIRA